MNKVEYQKMLYRLPVGMRYLPYDLFTVPEDTVWDLPKTVRTNGQEILEQIYALDERTKLPSSDVAVYLGENTHPEIKQYIKDNLFGDTHPLNLGTADVPDDVISELTRGVDEPAGIYAQRINKYIVDNGEKIKAVARFAKSDDKK